VFSFREKVRGGLSTHRFDVKTDGGDGGHYFAQLQLVQNGGLARRVKAHHQNTHVLLGHELCPYCAKDVSLRRQSAGKAKRGSRQHNGIMPISGAEMNGGQTPRAPLKLFNDIRCNNRNAAASIGLGKGTLTMV